MLDVAFTCCACDALQHIEAEGCDAIDGGEVPLYVKDVDAFHTEVRAKGVEPIEALQTQWWGDRNFALKDPYGYTLWVCQTVSTDLKPPPGVKMI